MQVSPRIVTCNMILRYVRARANARGTAVEKLYRLVDGKAEALEFIARKSDPYIGVPLKNAPHRAKVDGTEHSWFELPDGYKLTIWDLPSATSFAWFRMNGI